MDNKLAFYKASLVLGSKNLIMLRFYDLLSFVIGASLATLLLGENYLNYHEQYWLFVVGVIIVQAVLFSALSVYRDWFGESLFDRCINLALSWAILLLVSATSFFLFKVAEDFSRLWLLYSFGISSSISIVSRVVLHIAKFNQHRLGMNLKNVVIIGSDNSLGADLIRRMLDRPWAGYVPIAFFTNNSKFDQSSLGVEVVNDVSFLHSFIEERRRSSLSKQYAVKEVWVALPDSSSDLIDSVKSQLLDTATKVRFVPDGGLETFRSMMINRALDVPILSNTDSPFDKSSYSLKRALDLFFSALFLALLSPFLILVSLLIRVDSRGPIIYRQKRYGIDGTEFELYKFRSMAIEQSDQESFVQARVGDSRVTRIGTWLRRYSIDELPQLYNVIKGDMSIIGPRPHASSHNEYYRKKIDGYMGRHVVRPGITGWAQVNGLRGETPMLKDMRERVRYDIFYIKNWSLALDFFIMIKTFWVVLLAKGAY